MPPEERIRCPACGRENDRQQTCSFCGANLHETVASSDPQDDKALTGTHPAERAPSEQEQESFQHMAGPGQPLPRTPVLAPKFAGFWIRVLAYVFDSVVIQFIIWLLVAVGILGYTSGAGDGIVGDEVYQLLQTNFSSLFWLTLAVTLSYFTFFIGSRGQTPGKMLFGLKVIRADGGNPSYSQALIRTLGYYLNHILTLEIGFLWVAVDPRKQGLHDKIAGTYEIRPGLAQVERYEPPYPQIRAG